ncbi:hypothetical protein [Acetomicrobium sp. S15 = DSM 107314]|uniref:hypothetical protein n=1 Tax=Acetomicrobium sp. S15 = DSM 107314 TaxID=2529858 RepID=UPI0018E1D655|nr:hypothetical protein [Acetomicrobium sp. S15 = DSM 107314]
MSILAKRYVEIVANLRGVISNWERLSKVNRKFMVDTLSYALRAVNERAKA